MTKYIAEIHQPGGCDYTIECGTHIILLKANDWIHARAELERIITQPKDEDSDDPDFPDLDRIILYEINLSETMPVAHWMNIKKIVSQELERNERDEIERHEYEILKAKYGGK